MLEIEGISKSYRHGSPVFSDLTLSVPRGVFGLLGPNGAGKSTLMKIIVGMLEPDGGRVVFDGLDVSKEPKKIRQRLGYLPQDFNLYPDATAYDLLTHLAVLKGLTRAKGRKAEVEKLLWETNLLDICHKKLGTFSGGMRQRFGIAQALLGSPSLILVDEPTAGLDPEERYRLLNVLAQLRERATILLSTHIVQDIAELCPRMAVLAGGKIAACESPANAMARLRGKVWQTLLKPNALEAFATKHRVLSSRFVGGDVSVHFLADSDLSVEGTIVDPTLEDFYFSIVGSGITGKFNHVG